MKNSILLVILSFFTFGTFAQGLKYTEEKSPEISKVLAKVHAINSFGFKNHLVKTYVVNNDLGYTKDDSPEGAKQFLYISDSELGKEITTKLYKTDSLVNLEVLEVVEAPEGYEIKIAYGLNEDRTEETFLLKIAKKQ
ncbi:hypothetical protein [Flavobacterium phycosphaerae]|uniref:hypothetical protein n=1 Tax=Flavobacterium phycosphaerae TaxID=2697515 RepID=UPI00138A1249|nr:hypothetical protein [Flavobacterium phycosphaerae]